MKNKEEIKKNIKTLIKIRDDEEIKPSVKIQAIQNLQKLISDEDPETQNNLKALRQIRDDVTVSKAVCIQAIQSMNKIIALVEGEEVDDRLTEDDIMEKIRKARKK